MLSLLPEGLSAVAFWAIMSACFAGSFIPVAFGIGAGGLLLALLASLVPPAALIPIHGVVQTGSNAGRMLMLWREIFWPALPWFAFGTVIGVTVGGAVAVELPLQFVQIGVGAFVIYTSMARAPRWFCRWPLFMGLISSFLTMFFRSDGVVRSRLHQIPRAAAPRSRGNTCDPYEGAAWAEGRRIRAAGVHVW